LWPARLHAIAASTVTSSASGTQPTAERVLVSMLRQFEHESPERGVVPVPVHRGRRH
jgi:hypothetical protein